MRRGLLIAVAAGFLCLIALLWLRSPSRQVQPQPTPVSDADSNPAPPPHAAAEPPPDERAGSSTSTPIGAATTDTTTSATNSRSQEPPWFLSLNTPISFYGKTVDENGTPLPGVRVYFGRVDQSPSNYTETTTESDSTGLFSLTGVTGKSIDVRLEKQGYYFSRTQNPLAFEYSNPYDKYYHRPDPANPVIFHLKEKGQAEPLLVGKKDVVVPGDGSPVDMDLSTGRKAAAGQGNFVVRYQRGNLETQYDWDCVIEVPGGGLIEFTNEFEFLAPEGGYRPTEEIKMSRSAAGWQSGAARRYFLRLANGSFARMQFEMITGTADFFHIEYFLNPSGSRNLEFDPSKAIPTSN